METLELLSSPDVCRLAGISYRQLDYWSRSGLLKPHGGIGSGTQRGFDAKEVRIACLVGELLRFGVSAQVARRVVGCLRESNDDLWSGAILIDVDGRIRPVPGYSADKPSSWLINLRRLTAA